MKNNRDMFYENSGYFVGPNGYGGVPVMPNTMPNQNMGYNPGLTNPQNPFPNDTYETLEQKVNRLERFCKRLDNRISKLENMYSNKTSSEYNITENNDIYMI